MSQTATAVWRLVSPETQSPRMHPESHLPWFIRERACVRHNGAAFGVKIYKRYFQIVNHTIQHPVGTRSPWFIQECPSTWLVPLVSVSLTGRSVCTASVVGRSMQWQPCLSRWRRRSPSSCTTSRGTPPRTTTRAAPWRSTPGSHQASNQNRYLVSAHSQRMQGRPGWRYAVGVIFLGHSQAALNTHSEMHFHCFMLLLLCTTQHMVTLSCQDIVIAPVLSRHAGAHKLCRLMHNKGGVCSQSLLWCLPTQ